MAGKPIRSADIGKAIAQATGKALDPPRTSTAPSDEVARFLQTFKEITEKSKKYSLKFD